ESAGPTAATRTTCRTRSCRPVEAIRIDVDEAPQSNVLLRENRERVVAAVSYKVDLDKKVAGRSIRQVEVGELVHPGRQATSRDVRNLRRSELRSAGVGL